MSTQKIKNEVSKKKGYKLGRALEAAIDPARATYTRSANELSTVIDTGKKAIVVDGELPVLPEYLREFAFRYALENRSIADWARLFHVATATISNWLRRPDVLKYVMTLRYERRLQIVEMTTQAEGKALKKLNEILEQDVSPANVQALLTAIFKTLSMVKEGRVPSETNESSFNFTLNTFSDNRQINVAQEQLEAQFQELDAVERMLTRKHERVAFPVDPPKGEE